MVIKVQFSFSPTKNQERHGTHCTYLQLSHIHDKTTEEVSLFERKTYIGTYSYNVKHNNFEESLLESVLNSRFLNVF